MDFYFMNKYQYKQVLSSIKKVAKATQLLLVDESKGTENIIKFIRTIDRDEAIKLQASVETLNQREFYHTIEMLHRIFKYGYDPIVERVNVLDEVIEDFEKSLPELEAVFSIITKFELRFLMYMNHVIDDAYRAMETNPYCTSLDIKMKNVTLFKKGAPLEELVELANKIRVQ